MGKRRAPNHIAELAKDWLAKNTEDSLLARVQLIWPKLVGAQIAENTEVITANEGRLLVSCSNSLWVNELTLMAADITERLIESLEEESILELRFVLKKNH